MALHYPSTSLVQGRIISWPASDGTNPPRQPHYLGNRHVIDEEGKFSYTVEVEPGDDTYDEWLQDVGTFIAKSMLKNVTDGGAYWMEGLPFGYTLYRRFTGNNKKSRSDAYLWGARKNHVFRSPNEFIPHAMWLLRGADPDDPCECKYCTDKVKPSQIDINARLGLPGIRSHHDRHHHR